MTDLNFRINYKENNTDDIYIQYVSEMRVVTLSSIMNKTENDNKKEVDMSKLSKIRLQKSLTDIKNPKINIDCMGTPTLLIGKRGALNITLGIKDYGDYIREYIDRGDYIHYFNHRGLEYVSILNRDVAKALIDICIDSFFDKFNRHPNNIYIKIISKKGFSNIITNYQPNDNHRYKLIIDP